MTMTTTKKMTMNRFLLGAVALGLVTAAVSAKEVTIELPPEPSTFKTAPGIELAQANCLICHSAEYPRMQPAMPKKFWEANVKKMREKYGAPVPEEAVPGLVEYLTQAYGKPEAAK